MKRFYGLFLSFSLACLANLNADHHPVVPAYDRFYETTKDTEQVAAGRLLMGELNCAGCHQNESLQEISKQPPILTEVGSRVKPDYLRKFISNPHDTKPGTTMPNALGSLEGDEKDQAVDSLVHYLVSLNDKLPESGYAPGSGRVRGETLFHSIGCAACHGGRTEGAKELAHAVPLGNPDEKYTIKSLAEFLQDPLHVRVSGRMPHFDLTRRDAQAIAAYLLPSVPEKPGIEYAYYEGSWNKLPNFDDLKPVAVGSAQAFEVRKLAKKGDGIGFRFEGVLQILEAGEYEFELRSDDGSSLKIDGKMVVDHDGVHGATSKNGKTKLTKGRHSVQIDFFEAGGEEVLEAWYTGPGVDHRDLAEVLLSAKPTRELEKVEFEVDRALAKKGSALFASLGCVQCHESGNAKAKSGFAKSLNKSSDAGGGCLAAEASTKAAVPWYGLSDGQRAAIRSAVSSGSAMNEDPDALVHSTMMRMNCVACHKRDDQGGVIEEINEYFTGTQPEMGDEGRVPPYLTGVGAKIKPEYLANLVAKGGKDRPYMNTRMPGFGEGNTKALVAALGTADKLTDTLPKVTVDRKEAKKAARQMVGSKGFSCIKCHTFGRFKATGVQSIDMTKMTERLQEEWFRQYVRDPIKFRPGTRMPAAWPPTGPSMLKKPLGGDSEKQIAAVWTYLTDAARAKVPEGLGGESMELMAISEAVIYRNFIEGAGPRAIGVGYPEGFNLAFDANDLRLALIWQGAFIDASRHWKGRGQGFQPPLGEKVIKLPAGVSFAVLDDAESDWPEKSARDLEGYQFLGYSLTTDQRPTFRYRVGGYEIHDMPNAVDETGRIALTRKITVKGKGSGTLYYRAAAGDVKQDGETYQSADVTMKFKLPAGSEPVMKSADGGNQLLIPLKPGQTLEQDYMW